MSSRPANQQPGGFKAQRMRGSVPSTQWKLVKAMLDEASKWTPTTLSTRPVIEGARGRVNPPELTADIPYETMELLREMRRDWHREPSTYNSTRSRWK